jgi:hypothetical protein
VKNPGIRPDLSGTDCQRWYLTEVDFYEADLRGASFFQGFLSEANLAGADLREANLMYADLAEANLHGADLRGAMFFKTDLINANLSGADLSGTSLLIVNLVGANLSRVSLYETVFCDTDLTNARGLDSCKHVGPCSIDHRTLLKSGKLPPGFLRGCGVPPELQDGLPRIMAEVRYHTCFISYGEPDRAFAEKLVQDLTVRGVICWLYALNATPGQRSWQEIGQKRREAEKMVVLCSVKALMRDGVLKEIEEQIDEEPNKIVPISLDEDWKHPGFRMVRGTRDLKPFLLDRNYADFANVPYEEALARLLRGLER